MKKKLKKNKKKKMSTDEFEMNYDRSMNDFDEERVNSSIIYDVQNKY